MTNELTLLDALLPQIVDWAQREEARALSDGIALSRSETELATRIGVRFPGKVRLLRVPQMPFPRDAQVRHAAQNFGLISPYTTGMALRYGIFLRDDIWENRAQIVAHELVHTAQYERLGGFENFLRQYLGECLTVGYLNSPLEREAIETAKRLFST